MADPANPSGPRPIAGTGSDTTQGVLNALANGVTGGFGGITIGGAKVVASYDAAGATNSATITTKGADGSAPCTISRPSGSGAGIAALVADRTAGTHCLQFARSSADDHGARSGSHLTYVPFATDAVAYAIREDSNLNRNLSVANLVKIYTCDSAFAATTKPLLPQSGSGTRKFFLQNVLNLTDSADFTTLHPCVSDDDPTTPGLKLLENTGSLLTDPKHIAPYSVSSYIAQTAKAVTDVHGSVLLGNVGGTNSLVLNTSAPGTRPVFNVVPNVLVAGPSNTKTVFVGPTSQVCANAATINKLGFATNPSCGDTTIQTDASNGADTVGPGE